VALPLELGGIQNPDVRRAFEQVSLAFPVRAQNVANDLLLLAVTGTTRKAAFGTTTIHFAAAITSNVVTVNHGLGVAPVSVIVTCETNAFGAVVVPGTQTRTATSFDVFGEIRVAQTIDIVLDWVAIG
jgi:hypothetical protein